MTRDRGFTLLEVLLAIVLLAVVVGVCAPYLRSDRTASTYQEINEFHTQVAEALSITRLSHANHMTFDEIQSWASQNGWSCTRIDRHAGTSDIEATLGVWVSVSDGRSQSIHWVTLPKQERGS